jgi:hypothetical protein
MVECLAGHTNLAVIMAVANLSMDQRSALEPLMEI